MFETIARTPCAATAGAYLAVALGMTLACSPAGAQQAAKVQKAAAQSAAPTQSQPASKGAQAIVVLVNDEPVTAYEIEQRAALIAAGSSGGGGDMKTKAEARWAQIIKDPRTNEHLQQLLREKNVKSEAEARAVQASYAKNLQHDMVEQLRREARAARLPQFRKEAEEELIEERLKIQEAKKLGLDIPEEDIKRVMKGLAEQNKMTEPQFIDHLKSMGIDASTMRERYRGQFAWRDVIRRKFANQITINDRDIDRMITSTASASGEDTVELQVQKITLAMPAGYDQAALARRYSEAEALQHKYSGCKTMAGLVKDAVAAKFEDAKFVKPSAIAEPTRSMLLGAKDGDILPPATVAGGVELYAVCSRRAANTDLKQREKAQGELAQREYEIMAKRYIRNLRQDAHIEYR